MYCPHAVVFCHNSDAHLILGALQSSIWQSGLSNHGGDLSLNSPLSVAHTQTKSPLLMNVIRDQRKLLELTDEQLQLIKCFLCPDLMVQSPETPLPRDANEEILELGQDGQPRLKVKQVPPDQMEDPIHALFNPPEGSRDGESACTHGLHACRWSWVNHSSTVISVHPFACLSVSVYLSVCLSVRLAVCLAVCL